MGRTLDELREVAVAHGYSGDEPKTIAGAIGALADTLAGSDVDSGGTIAEAVRALAPYVGGGAPKFTKNYPFQLVKASALVCIYLSKADAENDTYSHNAVCCDNNWSTSMDENVAVGAYVTVSGMKDYTVTLTDVTGKTAVEYERLSGGRIGFVFPDLGAPIKLDLAV